MRQIQLRVLRQLFVLSLAIAAGAMFFVSHLPALAVVTAASMLWFAHGSSIGNIAGWQTGTSTVETLSALSGDIKTVYGNELIQVLPDSAPLQAKFPLADSAAYPMVGDYFSALIGLQFPWGFSFQGQGTENTTTNTVLGEALAGQTQPAKIYPCMTVLTDNLSYFILDRAPKSNSTQAVLSALTYTGKQMAIIMRNVLELQILHGREGIATVDGATSGSGPYVFSLDPNSTSPGILSLLIGARLQFMQTDNTSARTANSTSNYLTVTAVDFVSSTTHYTVTASATGTTNVAAVTTGDLMFIAGTRGVSVASSDVNVPQYEQIGLGYQLSAVTGTIFNIDKAAYPGWVANQIASIGTFSPSVLMQAAQKSLSRGGEMGNYTAICSPAQWAVLNSALATNETYNQQAPSFAMSKKTGTDEIVIKHGGITIEVMAHPLQKDGKFYLVPDSEVKRIGSVDLTFAIPGRGDGQEEYWYPIAGQSVMQRQCRADWQTVCLKPPSACVGTGITFS